MCIQRKLEIYSCLHHISTAQFVWKIVATSHGPNHSSCIGKHNLFYDFTDFYKVAIGIITDTASGKLLYTAYKLSLYMSPCVHFALLIVFIVHSTVVNFNNHFVISKMISFSLLGLVFSASCFLFFSAALFSPAILFLFSLLLFLPGVDYETKGIWAETCRRPHHLHRSSTHIHFISVKPCFVLRIYVVIAHISVVLFPFVVIFVSL